MEVKRKDRGRPAIGDGKAATLESKNSVLEHSFMKKTRGRSTHTYILYAFGFSLDFSKSETPLFFFSLCVCSFQISSAEMDDTNIVKCFIS